MQRDRDNHGCVYGARCARNPICFFAIDRKRIKRSDAPHGIDQVQRALFTDIAFPVRSVVAFDHDLLVRARGILKREMKLALRQSGFERMQAGRAGSHGRKKGEKGQEGLDTSLAHEGTLPESYRTVQGPVGPETPEKKSAILTFHARPSRVKNTPCFPGSL